MNPEPRFASCVRAQPPALPLPGAQEQQSLSHSPRRVEEEHCQLCHPQEGVLGNSSHGGTCRGMICKTRQLLQL